MNQPTPTYPGRDFAADVALIASLIAAGRLESGRPHSYDIAEHLGFDYRAADFSHGPKRRYCRAVRTAAVERLMDAARLGLAVLAMPTDTALMRLDESEHPDEPWAIYECIAGGFFGQGHGDEWTCVAEGATPLEALKAAEERSTTP